MSIKSDLELLIIKDFITSLPIEDFECFRNVFRNIESILYDVEDANHTISLAINANEDYDVIKHIIQQTSIDCLHYSLINKEREELLMIDLKDNALSILDSDVISHNGIAITLSIELIDSNNDTLLFIEKDKLSKSDLEELFDFMYNDANISLSFFRRSIKAIRNNFRPSEYNNESADIHIIPFVDITGREAYCITYSYELCMIYIESVNNRKDKIGIYMSKREFEDLRDKLLCN